MTWPSRGWLAVLLPAAVVVGIGGVHAQTLVVKASGPSAPQYPAGRRLPAGASVKLAGGDMIVLLDAQGTRTLRGPGTFPVAASSPTQVASNSGVAALLSARRTGLARTGAVRGVEDDGPARSPNLWYVDVSQPQTACQPDLAAVKLWRADMTAPATYRIAPAAGGAPVPVVFAAGQAAAAWPAKLPISDGAKFTVSGGGLSAPVPIRFAKVDAPPVQPDAVADSLISHGCSVQLDLLLSAVPARDAAP